MTFRVDPARISLRNPGSVLPPRGPGSMSSTIAQPATTLAIFSIAAAARKQYESWQNSLSGSARLYHGIADLAGSDVCGTADGNCCRFPNGDDFWPPSARRAIAARRCICTPTRCGWSGPPGCRLPGQPPRQWFILVLPCLLAVYSACSASSPAALVLVRYTDLAARPGLRHRRASGSTGGGVESGCSSPRRYPVPVRATCLR